MIQIKIVGATVYLTNGMDMVSLETEHPCSYCKEYLPSQPLLVLEFKATEGTGIDYCRNHLGIEPKVRNIR